MPIPTCPRVTFSHPSSSRAGQPPDFEPVFWLAHRLLSEGRSIETDMIDALFNQPNYLATKKLLDATVLRHEAIASNLANVETPGYRRIDLAPSFQTELQRAVVSQAPGQIAQLQPRLAIDITAVANTRDGNTVQIENELMQLNQNAVAHTLEANLLTGALSRMRLAITGRAS